MSSHHFVKEGQEPALFILDSFSFHLAAPLLEWAPLVLVSESALDGVLQWGIKIDVVFAEESRVELLKQKLIDQTPVRILSHQKGESPLINALYFLTASKQAGVNIMATLSDDLFRETQNCMQQLQVSLWDEKMKWSAISSGYFEKWLPGKATLQIRKSLDSQSLQFQGLTRIENGFEASKNGIISIQSDHLFWVAEYFD